MNRRTFVSTALLSLGVPVVGKTTPTIPKPTDVHYWPPILETVKFIPCIHKYIRLDGIEGEDGDVGCPGHVSETDPSTRDD